MSNTVSLKVGSSPLKMTAFHNAATDDDDDVDVGSVLRLQTTLQDE